MPKFAARTDRNHAEIMDGLRKAGASVFNAAAVGRGFPDIVVGHRGRTFLLEIKDGSLPPSRRKLSDPEQRFFDGWRGHACVVTTVDEALQAVGIAGRGGLVSEGDEV